MVAEAAERAELIEGMTATRKPQFRLTVSHSTPKPPTVTKPKSPTATTKKKRPKKKDRKPTAAQRSQVRPTRRP